MKLFYIPQMKYLADELDVEHGKCLFKRFSDGELYVRLEEDVHDQDVWVLVATQPPTSHFFEVFFLLDALQRAGARVSLLLTYLGYERQDRANKGEALSAEVVANCFKQFALRRTVIIHAHSERLHDFLVFTNVMPIALMAQAAQDYDAEVIVAPDDGARDMAAAVAEQAGLPCAYVSKMRPDHETVEIMKIQGLVVGKRAFIVDDVISTGRTILKASEYVHKAEAKSVTVMATHGCFSDETRIKIQSVDFIKALIVTNSLPCAYDGKVTIVSIAPLIMDIMETSD